MENTQTYRASLFWKINVIAGAIVGLTGAIVFPAIVALYFLQGISSQIRLPLFGLFAISALLLFLAYFPGNLGVFWPYAVEVTFNSGVRLSGVFKRIFIPISEIDVIENSLFWQGYVVHLLKPHGVLTQFVIPWYFGSQREELIRTIRLATQQSNN